MQDALILILPLNIANACNNKLPLQENDAVFVCIFYSCLGSLALIVNLITHLGTAKRIEKYERFVLISAALFTMLGLVL